MISDQEQKQLDGNGHLKESDKKTKKCAEFKCLKMFKLSIILIPKGK